MTIKNPLHLHLLKIFSNYKSNSDQKQLDWVKKYLGSNKIYQGINTGDMIKIASNLIKENNFDQKSLVNLLNSL